MIDLKIYSTFCSWRNMKLQDRFVGLSFLLTENLLFWQSGWRLELKKEMLLACTMIQWLLSLWYGEKIVLQPWSNWRIICQSFRYTFLGCLCCSEMWCYHDYDWGFNSKLTFFCIEMLYDLPFVRFCICYLWGQGWTWWVGRVCRRIRN